MQGKLSDKDFPYLVPPGNAKAAAKTLHAGDVPLATGMSVRTKPRGEAGKAKEQEKETQISSSSPPMVVRAPGVDKCARELRGAAQVLRAAVHCTVLLCTAHDTVLCAVHSCCALRTTQCARDTRQTPPDAQQALHKTHSNTTHNTQRTTHAMQDAHTRSCSDLPASMHAFPGPSRHLPRASVRGVEGVAVLSATRLASAIGLSLKSWTLMQVFVIGGMAYNEICAAYTVSKVRVA